MSKKRYIVKGRRLPDQDILDVFVEFCSLESVVSKGEEHQKKYVVIRLVTIIEEFFRNIVKGQLENSPLVITGKIELELSLIDELIKTASNRTREITKEEIISASYSFQNIEAIHNAMSEYKIYTFKGLKKEDYGKLFELRHELVHTVKAPPSFDAQRCYDLTKELMMSTLGKIKDADSFYSLKIEALQKLGKHDEVQECYDEAKKRFEEAIILKPGDADAYYDWGVVLQMLEKHREAVTCFDKVIEVKPDDAEVHYSKGVSLQELEDHKEAVKCLDRVIELDPDDAEVHYSKGVSLQELEDHREAIKCFDIAAGLDPAEPFVYFNKGVSLQKLGEHDKSKECFVNALARFISTRESNSTDLHYGSGLAWQKLEMHDVAIRCFDKVLEMKPNDVEAYLDKGESLLSQEKYYDAKECFDMVLKLDPKNEDAKSRKAEFEKLYNDRHHM